MNRRTVALALCVAVMPLETLAVPPVPRGSPTIVGIGFIGDSITAGEGVMVSPPSVVAALLSDRRSVVFAFNRGRRGTATWDWLPGNGQLEMAKRSFAEHGVHRVHIALGTNDARRSIHTSPEQYAANLAAITADLAKAGFEPVVSAPTALLATSPCGSFSTESPALVREYARVATESTFAGRAAGATFSAFDQNAQLLSRDQIHPTQQGVTTVATAWANSLR